MGKKSQKGSVLIIALVLIILVLGLSGAAFSLYQFSREKSVRPFQVSAAAGVADRGREETIDFLKEWAGRNAVSDPQWAFFFTGGDLNGDGKIARDGEVDLNRNGAIDLSPMVIRVAAQTIGRRTFEDVNGNHREDLPDGALEDIAGNFLGNDEDTGSDGLLDFNEPGYALLTNPDPTGDNYHPIFNPTGTEGNGKRDPGEPDTINVGKLDTIEDGSRWIRWGKRVRSAARVSRGNGEVALDDERFIKVLEVNSLIDLNGPDHLTARLLNNLFRAIRLKELFIDPSPMTNPEQNNIIQEVILGQNGRGLEYDPNLDTGIAGINFSPPPPSQCADAHAVCVIQQRKALPGRRFTTKDQLFEVIKKLGLLTVNDTDEWLRLRDLVTVHAVHDPTVVRQNPASPTGPPIPDPRAPVNINTAPEAVLEAVFMAGMERNLIAGASTDNLFAAGRTLAQMVLTYRMGIDLGGLFSQEGSIKSWPQFESDFLTKAIGSLPAGPSDPVENRLLSANLARLIAQANPNTRLQRFNPDAAMRLSIDKSQISFPTTEFSFSGDGRFEINALGLLIRGEQLLSPFAAPTQVNRVLSPGGGEIARRETLSVVRVFDVLKHTTQADFEGETAGGHTGFTMKSFPENQADFQFTFDAAPSETVAVSAPGQMTIDQKTGLVYVASDTADDQVRVINFDLAIPAIVGNPIPNPAVSGMVISGLSISTGFPGTNLGRLALGIGGISPAIRMFDIGGTVASPVATPKAFHDLTIASTPGRLVQGDGWDLLFNAGTNIGKTRYPFADSEAVPESDDPATSAINEAGNCPADEDGDGVCDDQIPDVFSVPERDDPLTPLVDERFDGVDDDGDGLADDAVFPLPAKPIVTSMDTTSCTSPPTPAAFTELVYDGRLQQAFAVDASPSRFLWRIRKKVDGGLEARDITPGTCALALGFTPRGLGVDEARGEILVTEAVASDLVLHRYSSKGEAGSLTALETLTLPGMNAGTSDGRIAVDSSSHLIFFISNNGTRIRVVDHRGGTLSLLPAASCGPMTGLKDIALDSRRRRVFASAATSLAMCAYSLTAAPAKRLDLDGQVRISPDSTPVEVPSIPTKVMLHANLNGSLDRIRPPASSVSTGEEWMPPGVIKQIGVSGGATFPPQGSLFTTSRLAPDGALTKSLSTSSSVTAEILAYDPNSTGSGMVPGIYEPLTDGNGIADSTATVGEDDVQLVPFGSSVTAGQQIIAPGPNGSIDTLVEAGDMIMPRFGLSGIYEPLTTGNGIADSTASGDDVQLIPLGTTGLSAGTRIIGPGPNGSIDSTRVADDIYVPNSGVPGIYEPLTGGDGVVNSIPIGGDLFIPPVTAVGDRVYPGQRIIGPGLNGSIDSLVEKRDVLVPAFGASGIYEPLSGGDLKAYSIAGGDDVQLVPFGSSVTAGQQIIAPGPNGSIDTGPVIYEPFVGGNGIADTRKNTSSDDIQVVPIGIYEPLTGGNGTADSSLSGDDTFIPPVTGLGNPVTPAQQIIGPGPDGILQSLPSGDDLPGKPVLPGDVIIGPGPNLKLDSLVSGDDQSFSDDIYIPNTGIPGIYEPLTGGDRNAGSTATGDDIQMIPVGANNVYPGQRIIGPGLNGTIDSTVGGDDRLFGNFGVPGVFEPLAGDKKVNSPLRSDDTFVLPITAVTNPVAPGQRFITPGPNRGLDSPASGDDLLMPNCELPGIYEPETGGNGRSDTQVVPTDDDILLVPDGSLVAAGQRLISPGPNRKVDSIAAAGDVRVRLYGFPGIYEPTACGNGIADTRKSPGSDDIQVVPIGIYEPMTGGNGTADSGLSGDDTFIPPVTGLGNPVTPGQQIIGPGPDGILQSLSSGDDLPGKPVSPGQMVIAPGPNGIIDSDGSGDDVFAHEAIGLRDGALAFWFKLDGLTNPWAVPETNTVDGFDNDGDGFVDDNATHAAGQPEINTADGIDNDQDGFVDDHVGLNLANLPDKVILYRFFHKGKVDPAFFITKSTSGTPQGQLGTILGVTVDPNSPITFSPPLVDYYILTRFYLDTFQDTNADDLVDLANFHLERYADTGTSPITVTYTSGGTPQTTAFDPTALNQITSPAVTLPLSEGKWEHVAFSWRIDEDAALKEVVQQHLFINGALQSAGTATNTPQLDPDDTIAGFESGTASRDLLDNDAGGLVDEGFSQGPSFLQFGAIILDPTPPPARVRATIDDIVWYNTDTALPVSSFTPSRFSAQSEAFTDTAGGPLDNNLFDPGEPFQDFNLDGKRNDPITEPGDLFTDQNDNGIYDVREPFGGYYPALAGLGRYDFYGERYFDQNGNAQFDIGEPFEDFNQSGQFDLSELYHDTNKNGQYDSGESFIDQNKSGTYDGNGYLANTFSMTIPAGSRIGTLAWTEYRPAGTAISVTLRLKAADGRILWQWFSENKSAEGVPVNLVVSEESRLEYRVNFYAQAAAMSSPIFEDLRVSVILEPQVLYSQERIRPFQFDPSIGPVS